jgi:hypothetical protein
MKRSSPVAAPKKGEWVCPDKEWAKEYPTLCQGLCDPWWDDGKPRQCWSLTVRFEPDAVHLCVNDKDSSSGLYTTGEDLSGALALLEEALSQGTASWRKWRK